MKCTKMKDTRAQRGKLQFFIAKYEICDVFVAVVMVA